MYKLVLGVGWNALKTRFQSYDVNPRVVDWMRIDQHKILLNKSIRDCYIESAKMDGINIDALNQYLANINLSQEHFQKSNVEGDNLKSIFEGYFAGMQYDEGALILAQGDPTCRTSKCKSQFDINEGVFTERNSVMSLYSMDNSVRLYPGDSASRYLTVIRHILKGERKVSFIDPYIATDCKKFIDVYLPMLERGAELSLFLAEDEGETNYSRLKMAADEYNVRLTIYLCVKSTMHDRFITTSDAILTIGAGIYFFNGDKEVREVSTFDYQRREEDGIEFEKKLAGGSIKASV